MYKSPKKDNNNEADYFFYYIVFSYLQFQTLLEECETN